jgi:hypothetical protein
MTGLLWACSTPSSSDDEVAEGAPSALGSDDARIYGDLATEGGAPPMPGSVIVLGLRGCSIDGEAHATRYRHAFDDTIVVLKADGSVERFPGSTHPFELDGVPGVPDVNGDGVGDVGMIRPGVYDVAGRDCAIAGQASYAVTQHEQGKLPGWRDTNHDGILSDSERAASERRSDGLTDVLFHQGEGGAPAAVGCQVLVDMTGRDTSTLPR